MNVFADRAGVTQDHRAVQDLSNGTWYGSHVSGSNPSLFNLNGWLNDYGTQVGHLYSSRFAMSYVTGSHAFKTGFTNTSGFQDWGPGKPNLDEAYQFRNRVLVGLWRLAGPGYGRTRVKLNLGIYAQDQWTLRNVTLNVGLRFDYINGYNPAQVRPGGTYTPEFRFDPVYDLPNWKDISPRVGAAYDLLATARPRSRCLWAMRFCETTDPQKQVKLAIAYPLPKGFQASATFQNLPGINRLASYVATNAQIAPSLGRNLGACGTSVVCNATVAVDLIEPNTLREPRQSQLDVRLSKLIRMGPVSLQGKFDVYNLFNANDIQLMITRYGSSWLNASSILAGRTFKFGAQLDF